MLWVSEPSPLDALHLNCPMCFHWSRLISRSPFPKIYIEKKNSWLKTLKFGPRNNWFIEILSWFRTSIDHNLVPHNRWVLTTLVGFYFQHYQTTRPGEMGIPRIGRTVGQLRPSAPNEDRSRGKFWQRCLKVRYIKI